MSALSQLATQQNAFAQAVRDAKQIGDLLPMLSGDAGLNTRRLALYRGNVVAHAGRALQAAYPVLEQIVGAEFFTGLSRTFWKARPPQSGDWNEYGRAMADFLQDFEPAAAMAYLPDLARLEWCAHAATYAADSPAIHEADSPAIKEVQDDPLTLLRRPGTAVLASQHPVADIWHAHQADASIALADIAWEPQGAIVFRKGMAVQVAALPHEQAAALAALINELE
jgi:uncharacterized protein